MKTPKKVLITKKTKAVFMRPQEAQHYLNVSTFSIYHNIVKKHDIYAKKGDKFILIEGYKMPLVDFTELPEETNQRKNYIINNN
jgi:hypothetical protein